MGSLEALSAELDRAFQKLGRDAQIRGFRKGKVPRPVLKQYFGGQVVSDVFRKLIDQSLPDVIRDQKLGDKGPNAAPRWHEIGPGSPTELCRDSRRGWEIPGTFRLRESPKSCSQRRTS